MIEKVWQQLNNVNIVYAELYYSQHNNTQKKRNFK